METTTWTCEWYLLCTNQTTQAVDHPVLGPVPCCARCAKKHDLRFTHDLVPVDS